MRIFSSGRIRAAVDAAVQQATRQPFTLASLAEASGLAPSQVFGVLRHMLLAGVVRVVGEQHEPGKPGRGIRVYAAVQGLVATEAVAERKDGSAAVLERVRAIVAEFSERFDFTAADVVKRLGLHHETVRWALTILEREGAARSLIEIRPNEVAGRPAHRWTSNPANIAAQNELEQKLREVEGS
jgi:predicted ArsR family transcriptional regulator